MRFVCYANAAFPMHACIWAVPVMTCGPIASQVVGADVVRNAVSMHMEWMGVYRRLVKGRDLEGLEVLVAWIRLFRCHPFSAMRGARSFLLDDIFLTVSVTEVS